MVQPRKKGFTLIELIIGILYLLGDLSSHPYEDLAAEGDTRIYADWICDHVPGTHSRELLGILPNLQVYPKVLCPNLRLYLTV
jgi:hypothetical protein